MNERLMIEEASATSLKVSWSISQVKTSHLAHNSSQLSSNAPLKQHASNEPLLFMEIFCSLSSHEPMGLNIFLKLASLNKVTSINSTGQTNV